MEFANGKYTSGFVRQLKNRKGQPWLGTLKFRDTAGNYQQVSKMLDISAALEAQTTKKKNQTKAAETALGEWRDEMEAAAEAEAETLESTYTDATVMDYCRSRIDSMERMGNVEPSTIFDYRHTSRYLREGDAPIADIAVRDLTSGQVERWVEGLYSSDGQGLSAVVVSKALRLLKQCMRYAVAKDELPKDPTFGVKPPKRPRKDPNHLDDAARGRLIAALDAMEPTPFKVGAAIALYTGMREGEICALRWSRLPIENGVIKVGGDIEVREAIGHMTGGTYLKETKTGGSRRDIPLYGKLAEILQQRLTLMMGKCAEEGVAFQRDCFVLGDIDGSYYSPDILAREWTALAKVCNFVGQDGKRIRFHDLRHTFATAAIAAGVDVKSVASILGHANANMTLNIYASADPKAKRAAMEDIGKAIEKEAPTSNVIPFIKNGTEGE